MIRPVPVLIAAMLLSRPSMPKPEAERYAAALNEVGHDQALDPLLMVAIVHHESQWRPWAVSPDGEDYGLGQIRARFAGACRDDLDPVLSPSEGCREAKARLLDGVYNIKRIGATLAANRELCFDKVGSVAPERYLAGYQGLNRFATNTFCEPGQVTFEVMGYHKALLDRFFPPPPPPKAKLAAAKKEAAKKPAAEKPSPQPLSRKGRGESAVPHGSTAAVKPPAARGRGRLTATSPVPLSGSGFRSR